MKPKTEGMTDRERTGFEHDILLEAHNCQGKSPYECDTKISELAYKLRAYYREKIKGVGIERVVKEYVRNTPIAGDFDTTRALFFNDKAIEKLANAILKEIDKEMR